MLLHNTVVRISDIRRIEMVSTSISILFTITFSDGSTMALPVDRKGGDWCLKIIDMGRATSEAARREFSNSPAESEFSE